MKSELNLRDNKVEFNFPCLARYATGGFVVLFLSENDGTLIFSGSSNWKVGTHMVNWESLRSVAWKILPAGSTVTLTQE